MPAIVLLTHAQAMQRCPVPGSVLILVHDDLTQECAIAPGWDEVLHLQFHDVQHVEQLATAVVFTVGHARQALLFAERHKTAPEVVISCPDGGMRATAMAKYLCDKYDWPAYRATHLLGPNDWDAYSPHVFRIMYLADSMRHSERPCPASLAA